MAQALLNCPILRLLDISSCHKLSDAAIRSAATSCPQLESLDMSNCTCVSDETLREISLTCINLHFLNASYCSNISLEVSSYKSLECILLGGCCFVMVLTVFSFSFFPFCFEVCKIDHVNSS